MSQVIFGALNVVGRNKPLLLEETVKNIAAFADLHDFELDDIFNGSGAGWTLGSGVSLGGTGHGGLNQAVWDDGVTVYNGGWKYG